LRFNPDVVQKQIDECKRCIQHAEDEKKDSSIKVNSINDLIAQSTTTISTKQKEYLEYISKLEDYRKKLAGLTEAKQAHKKELEYLANYLSQDIGVVLSELKELSQQLFDIILQRVHFEESCFKYIDDSIQTWQSLIPSVTDHSLAFTSSIITSSNCVSIIQDEYISAGVRSTFCGKEEALDKLTAILNPGRSVDKDGVSNIINQIIDALYYDLRDTPKTPIEDIANQFRKESGISKQPRFYEYLFSCGFLSTITEIRSNGKSIDELSPGEKGTVLLVIYLLLDKSTNPLIIDQPEENLDNQSVYQILRPFILEAKKKRQVIIVTHNPNIAVTCDAEQVIYVHINKSDKNQFSFESGSIENPVINKHVSDILEGTLQAFNNRKVKYITS
jgi:DNA repair exonuclease SbcCD ATPase subunit